MAWLRLGDTAHGDPRRLALIDPKDEMIGKAAWGFFVDVADMCAEHFTDYVVPRGFIDRAGAGPGDVLLKRCIRAGLMFPAGGKGANRKWRIIDDAPELIHMRSRAEVQWEKDQKADTGNLRNRTAAMLRDGDACRWCGVVCQPHDHKAGRHRTLDHLNPGRKALSPDDLVTACQSCNGARGRDWQDEANRAGFAARWPLRSVPDTLIFRTSTRDWLASKGHQIPPGSIVVPSGVVLNDWTEATAAATQTPRKPAGRRQTRPATQVGAANSVSATSDDQHPGILPGVAAPDEHDGTTHPVTAGVAVPVQHDPPQTPGSGVDTPGRAGPGIGSPSPTPSPPSTTAPECAQHPAPPAGVASSESRTPPPDGPRRTRRGRRRPRSSRQEP